MIKMIRKKSTSCATLCLKRKQEKRSADRGREADQLLFRLVLKKYRFLVISSDEEALFGPFHLVCPRASVAF